MNASLQTSLSSLARLCCTFGREEEGQDLVEYSMLLGFITLSAIALMSHAGTSVKTLWVTINTATTSAAVAAS
jgi:Flp pilus assembly pilin Flp